MVGRLRINPLKRLMQDRSQELNLFGSTLLPGYLPPSGDSLDFGRNQHVVVSWKADQVAITFCKFCMINNSVRLAYIEIIFVMRVLSNVVIRWRHPRILSPFFSCDSRLKVN